MNRKFLRKVAFFSFWAIPFLALAQEEYSPSLPSNFGLPGIQTSENLSTGTLNITLPIDNPVVPVSMNFNTGGIKVDARPNELGMGWEMACGGHIVRERRGLSDDGPQGYCGANQRGQNVSVSSIGNWNADVFANYSNEDWDSEPDIFRFNFMGYVGAFVLTPSRTVVKLTPNNLKIVPNYNTANGGSFTSFTIYDENGNKYLFNARSTSVIKEGTQTLSNTVTKWSLNYIEDYKTGEQINFSYTLFDFNSRTQRYRYAYLRGNNSLKQEVWGDYEIENSEQKVSSVTFRNKEIQFFYKDRTGGAGKLIDYITIRTDNHLHLKYVFNYFYISGRPFLASVVKSDPSGNEKVVMYQFEYYGQGSDELVLPGLSVHSNVNQDHWGFYNDNYTNSLIKTGVGREPHLTRSMAGNIKRVYYPGGGYEEYLYEQNLYRTSGGVTLAAGGLRIREIHKSDGTNDYQVKTYDYKDNNGHQSGQLYATPNYLEPFTLRCYGNMADIEYLTKEFSSRNLYDFQGRHIIYKKVTATNIDGSKEVYYFNGYSDEETFYTGYPKLPSQYDYRYAEEHSGVSGWFDCAKKEFSKNALGVGEGWPYAYNYYGSYAGTLDRKIVQNSDDEKQVEEVYEYTRNAVNSIVYGAAFSMYEDYDGTAKKDNFKISVYRYQPVYILQNKVTRYVYDEENQDNRTTHITDLVYNNTYNLPTRTETYLSGDYANRNVTETTYLVQQPSGVSNVTSHNLIGAVKKVTQKKGTTTLAENLNIYGNTGNGKVELRETENRVNGNLISHQSVLYDATSQLPVGSTDEISSRSEVVIYDYNKNLVLAEVSNAQQNQVAYTNFEASASDDGGGWYRVSSSRNSSQKFLGSYAYSLSNGDIYKWDLPAGKYLLSYWKTSGTVNFYGMSSQLLVQTKTLGGWTLEEREVVMAGSGTLRLSGTTVIDELKIRSIDAAMTTYSYHPVFGKTSETDDNHNTIYYEYDPLGRMSVVKDDERNIVKTISQNVGKFMDVSRTSISFGYQGGDVSYLVTSNTSWEVNPTQPWILVNKTEGELSDVVTVTCLPNSGATRNGLIHMPHGVGSKTITVSQQSGAVSYLTIKNSNGSNLNGQYINAGHNPPPNTITVESNVNWSVSITTNSGPAGWPNDINITSGSGNGQFTIGASGVQPPPPNQYYEAVITVTGGGLTRQFSYYMAN